MKTKTTAAGADPVELLRQGCERPWEQATDPFRVAPHTYYVGNSWVGAYLIVTREGLVLIDAAMHCQVYLLFESIRRLGYDPKDIKILLLSHAHYDHCGGVRPVLEYTGAKLYMGREDEFFLTERPDLIFTEGYPFGLFRSDEYFDDSRPVVLGAMRIATRHTPGHTPGTTSFFFDDRDEDGRVYRCGMHGGIGVNTLSDDFFSRTGLPVSLRDDYIRGLESLVGEKVDIVLGSHPGQVDMLEKVPRDRSDFGPFVDGALWRKFLNRRIEMAKSLAK